MKEDKEYKGDLMEWIDECTQSTKELFELMDINKDNILSRQDLTDLVKVDLIGLVLDMGHRMQDIAEIAFDQLVDKMGPLPPGAGIYKDIGHFIYSSQEQETKLLNNYLEDKKKKEKLDKLPEVEVETVEDEVVVDESVQAKDEL